MNAETIVALCTGTAAVLAPTFTYLGARLSARKARREADQKLELEKKQLEDKAKEAAAKAAVETREAITADWVQFTQAIQQDRQILQARVQTLEERVTSNGTRLDTAEDRARIAEERAIRWESLYRIAVAHMRKLIAWASDISHMNGMPEAPAELVDVL